MSRPWQYPIYLVRHGSGYASIVNSGDGGTPPTQSLVVCRDESRAVAFMAECSILGMPTALHNDREFMWLLESLSAPVVDVVFDPSSDIEQARGALRIGIRELLDERLVADNSPWSYPVFVVAQDEGFVSINGPDDSGRPVTAIGFFSDEERIASYLEAAGETGTACALGDLEQTRKFLTRIADQVAAVAWNPEVTEGGRLARHCFSIVTLLEKYLVETGLDTDP